MHFSDKEWVFNTFVNYKSH